MNRYIKIHKILIILLICVFCMNSFSYAGLCSSARGEAPNAPAPPPSSSGKGSIPKGGSSITTTKKTDETKKSTTPKTIATSPPQPYYNGLNGNVWEDLNLYQEDIGNYNTNGVKDIEEPGVNNVIVQLIDSQNNLVAQTISDDSGYWSIDDVNEKALDNEAIEEEYLLNGMPIKCKLRFIYGLIEGNYESNQDNDNVKLLKELNIDISKNKSYTNDEIKNILKYNGNDYFATKLETVTSSLVSSTLMPTTTTKTTTKTFVSSYENHIITSGKGCSQIYLVIDCSGSMQETTIDENGNEVLKIDLVKEAAKALINKLLSTDENIYIGIVGYGEVGVRRQGLTNNIESLENAIDNILNLENGESYGSLSNIMNGLTAAEESFINNDGETSNRSIVLFSDGIPTAMGYENTMFLSGISNKTYDVLNRDDLTDISKSKSIKFESIYREDSDEVIKEKLYKYTEQTNELLKQLQDKGINISSVITQTDDAEEREVIRKLIDFIQNSYTTESMTEIREIFTTKVLETIEETIQENTVIIDSFKTPFCYDNEEHRKKINEQYKNGYNYLNLHEFEIINNYNGNLEAAKQFSLNNFMYLETEEAYNFLCSGDYAINYDNQNVFLTRREPCNLDIEKIVTGFKLTLADGQVLYDDVCEEAKVDFLEINANNSNPGNRRNQLLENLKDISTVPGANSYIEVIDEEIIHGATVEIEYAIKIKNNSSVTFNNIKIIDYLQDGTNINPNSQLLTETSKTNNDYGWTAQGIDENKLSQEVKDAGLSYSILDLQNTNLGNNGERYAKVVFSVLLSSEFEDLDFLNEIEVYEYSNSTNRRMEKMLEEYSTNSAGKTVKKIIGYEPIYPADRQGQDYDESMHVVLIPPLGKKLNNYIVYIGLGVALVIGILLIKKKVLK